MTRVVGVFPAHELRERARLMSSFSSLFPVRFVPVDAVSKGANHLDALLAFSSDRDLPDLCLDIPALIFATRGDSLDDAQIEFTTASALDPRLRNQTLRGECCPEGLPSEIHNSLLLATTGRRPIWVRKAIGQTSQDIVSVDIPELKPGELLRDRVVPGQWFGGLVAIHFLRELCADSLWTAPPTRAVFVIDDPNLHWLSYGRINFRDVARHAAEHAYHVAFASIPFDLNFANSTAVSFFSQAADHLSLTIHGNTHTQSELGNDDEGELLRLLAQAIRRTSRFESRTGLEVSRVMIPPYEVCSRAAMAQMVRLGFDSMSHTRSFPFLDTQKTRSPYGDLINSNLDAGFSPAVLNSDAFPVIIRRNFDCLDEIILHAFLDIPIVLYGHEEDFGNGLSVLEAAAVAVNRVPNVTWLNLHELSASNFLRLRHGTTLHVRPYARRIRVPLSDGVDQIVVEGLRPGANLEPSRDRGPAATIQEEELMQVDDSARLSIARRTSHHDTLNVVFRATNPVDAWAVTAPRRRPLGALRRLATEARDRSRSLSRSSSSHS